MTLPPGPRLPRSAQTLAWLTRPGPFLWKAHQRYGDAFTLNLASYPPLVFLSRPEHVREVLPDHALAEQEIHAVFPSPKLVPGKVTAFVAYLQGQFGDGWWAAPA